MKHIKILLYLSISISINAYYYIIPYYGINIIYNVIESKHTSTIDSVISESEQVLTPGS